MSGGVVSDTSKQEFQRMDRILKHIQKLSPINREWLMLRLTDVECRDTSTARWVRRTKGGR